MNSMEMSRVLFGLILIVSYIRAQNIDCSNGNIDFYEYLRVPGTDKTHYVDSGDFTVSAYPQFIWNGNQLVSISLNNYPGYLDAFSFASNHLSNRHHKIFPQTKYTNQLIEEEFDYVYNNIIALKGYAPAQTILNLGFTFDYQFNDEFFYAFQIQTVTPAGQKRTLWAAGTEFQVFNWGNHPDDGHYEQHRRLNGPLHHGFVNNNLRCGNAPSCPTAPLVSAIPVTVGSGNPAIFSYEPSSACNWTVSPVFSDKRNVGTHHIVVVLTWVGIGEGDLLTVSNADNSQSYDYQPGEFGYQVLHFANTDSVNIAWQVDDSKVFDENLPIYGFRAKVTDASELNCFVPSALGGLSACPNIFVSSCVETLVPACSTEWTDICTVVADLCENYVESNLASHAIAPNTTGLDDFTEFARSAAPTEHNGRYHVQFEQSASKNVINIMKAEQELAVENFPQLSKLLAKKMTVQKK